MGGNYITEGLENDNHHSSPYSTARLYPLNLSSKPYKPFTFKCACCGVEYRPSEVVLFKSLCRFIAIKCLPTLSIGRLQEIGRIIEDPTKCQLLLEEIEIHKPKN